MSMIRLYDFTPDQIRQLIAVFLTLADSHQSSIKLHEMPFIESLGGCELVLVLGSADRGISPTSKEKSFQCELTSESWRRAASLAEPFLKAPTGVYQWLCDLPQIAVEFLLSTDGAW